jgi:probable addiction module antidote protein
MKTTPFDPARYLDDEEGIAEYLRIICEEGSPAEIASALGDIARARGMSEVAEKAGLSRQALYKALSEDGNPELATIAKVAEALGFRLAIVPAQPKPQGANAV